MLERNEAVDFKVTKPLKADIDFCKFILAFFNPKNICEIE